MKKIKKVGDSWSHQHYLEKKVQSGQITALKDDWFLVNQFVKVNDPNRGFRCSDHGDSFSLFKGNKFKVVFQGSAYSMAEILIK
jgi:hypothetical protein